jgi:putative spermidine/putrescine transport system ATP-binding protein
MATNGEPLIRLQGIKKVFLTDEVETHALADVHLEIKQGEYVAISGPSGCGKTTLLSILGLLDTASDGEYLLDGRPVAGLNAADRARVRNRQIGFIFQAFNLIGDLTVYENVELPLTYRGMSATERKERVHAALERVGMSHRAKHYPAQLSGGQQQRVALARCFVYEPALILMDEPLGALDRKLRETMQIEIRRLHRDTGATIIFVTHDQEEALALSDRICLLNNARIEQLGSPQEIYERPQTLFAADFIGISNVLRGRVSASGQLSTPDGALPIPQDAQTALASGQEAALVIRPEYVEIVAPDSALVSGRVIESVYGGSETRLIVALSSGVQLVVRRRAGQDPVGIGDTVAIGWAPDKARFLPATP